MPDYFEKLRPDQDLQCYFFRPSAIAALSEASATGFKVSGSWRQQFDWCVVEWNRDNVYEHPAFRNLPNGDFTGYTLTYDESREYCHLMDSDLFPTVDWPMLRIWRRVNQVETLYKVRLRDYAVPIVGNWISPAAELELQGTITAGDFIGISFLDEQFNYEATSSDTLATAVEALKNNINAPLVRRIGATRSGNTLRVEYFNAGEGLAYPQTGFNGNRMGVYGFVSGARTETWSAEWSYFSGGQSPSKWRVTLPFGTMKDIDGVVVPATEIRKMRWTYGAQMQSSAYQRSEFVVTVANWTVTAPNRIYKLAGPGSRRIEDNDSAVTYSGGTWGSGLGNFSDGTIHYASTLGSQVALTYTCPQTHTLYLGSRFALSGADVRVKVDGNVALQESLLIAGEDTLCRLKIGQFGAGSHQVVAEHMGSTSPDQSPPFYFYFDFLEIAIEATEIPTFPATQKITLATDWDTDHSLAIAPERTAWILNRLGYRGRANHYVGALLHYELIRQGHVYASATVEFAGAPLWASGMLSEIVIGNIGYPDLAVIQHLHRIGDTAETVAKAFEFHLNSGYNSVHAEASGGMLTIWARAMGVEGNAFTLAAGTTQTGGYTVTKSSDRLSGGLNGDWRTDLTCVPRLNRAARDWSRAYYVALKNYGIDVVGAFSQELEHGDPSVAAGIAQRYYNGEPVLLNTPALQTNFSPTSIAFWKQVYLDMAEIMDSVGIVPYLQFGEVQWWYFPAGLPAGGTTGMTFYDQYTKDSFQAAYGRPMGAILSDFADPALYPDEVQFLPTLIGQFTDAVIGFVKAVYPAARFEVLYPTDVNNTPLNKLINYPPAHWTPVKLDNLKTESFTFTITRHLDNARITVDYGGTRGFTRAQRSFLVGIGDPTSPWHKEVEFALAENLESIVLFALDQYCLVGYATPLPAAMRRVTVQG